MSAIVGVDAMVLISPDGVNWTELPERNEFSINIKVDVASKKTFVNSLSNAWVQKRRTWMDWNGSLQGYYDDADDSIYDGVVKGDVVYMRFYDTRYENLTLQDVLDNVTKYWQGQAILTNVDHGTGSEDFSTLNLDFEGSGKLDRVSS